MLEMTNENFARLLRGLTIAVGKRRNRVLLGGVAGVVGIEGGVVSGVINLESSGVGASDWRPRHEEHYQEV